jgi:hypothetical protein
MKKPETFLQGFKDVTDKAAHIHYIRVLFNDAVCSSDYSASKDMMVNKQ